MVGMGTSQKPQMYRHDALEGDPVTPDDRTAAAFLSERRDFLYVYVVRSAGGSGWDVVMRLDGTYTDRADAEGVVAMYRTALTDGTFAADVRTDGRHWWEGPPWRKP